MRSNLNLLLLLLGAVILLFVFNIVYGSVRIPLGDIFRILSGASMEQDS